MAIQNNSCEIWEQWAYFNGHRNEIITTITANDYNNEFRCGNSFDVTYDPKAEAICVIDSETEYNSHSFWIVRSHVDDNVRYLFAMTNGRDPYTTYAINESIIGDIFDEFKNAALKNDSYTPNIVEVSLCEDHIVEGHVFIIPNSIVAIGEYPHHTYLSKKSYEKTNIKINGEHVVLEDGDLMVEVWVHGSGSENWCSHGVPFIINNSYIGDRFLKELPVKYLQNLKEGDSFDMEYCGQKIHLILDQNNSRYWEKGPFHVCLSKLIDHFKADHVA